MSVYVASAPISYGAFELTVGVDPAVPDPVEPLDRVRSAAYVGIDLGPVGYLGRGDDLGQRLSERDLGLAGGDLELHDQDYSGWIVVEQDIMPGPDDPADAHRHQVANRELLRAYGF